MDEQDYHRRLISSLDWAARTPDGQFLLQHFFRMTGPFVTAGESSGALWNDGRRSVGIELLELCKTCRNGEAIVKTILAQFIEEDMRQEGEADVHSYDPTSAVEQ